VHNAHWMGKDFTQLKTAQCNSFKYCIIVFKFKVTHYRHILVGGEHPGPDPAQYLLLSVEHKRAVDFLQLIYCLK